MNTFKAVESAATKSLDTLKSFTTVDKSLSEQLSFNQYPSNADSPFGAGRAYNIYESGGITGALFCARENEKYIC